MYQPWGPPPSPPWGSPSGPSVGWAVLLWVIAGVLLAGTLFCGLLAATGFMLDHQIDNNGVTTSATVTDVDDINVTVEFTTEDDYPATAEFTWWPDEDPAVGDRIEITYDPDDPTYVVRAGSTEDQEMALVCAGIGVFALVGAVGAGAGAVIIHRARGKAQRSTGYYY